MKKYFIIFALLTGAPACNGAIPADVPIHLLTGSNATALVALVIKKSQTYEKIRSLLLDQLKHEAISITNESEQLPSNAIKRVRSADHAQLRNIVGAIVGQRHAYEQEFGDALLAEKMGYEANKEERERVAQYEQLLSTAVKYELLVPQLRTALIGTSLASLFTAMRRFGLLS